MKRLLKIIVCILFAGTIFSQSRSFTTYMNPVIPGDHPDNTLTRVGKFFYTTGSSFSTTPKIYRSTNLVNWEVVSQPVSNSWSLFGRNPTDGCWGGHVVKYNNKFWHFFGRASTMYYVTADEVEGPWSQPVALKNPPGISALGMDNSIFIDDDGSWYLLSKHGRENNFIVQLGNDGQPEGSIYNLSWLNPAPDYPYSWAEGPVMWKYKGYYYYSFARNLAGGQYVYRTTQLTSDKSGWENLGNLFSNPTSSTLFPGPNHCSPAIVLDDSTSWIFYHAYSISEWEGQGRQGLLSQVRYDANLKPVVDFPINTPMVAPNLPSSGIPWTVPKSDFFDSDKLNPEWSLLGYSPTVNYSLTERPGWLRLLPRNQHNTVIKNDAEQNYSLITKMEANPTSNRHEAGIRIMTGLQNYSAKLYVSVNNSNQKAIFFGFDATLYQVENNIGDIIWLKLVRENHNLSGYYSSDGKDWIKLGNTINVSAMDKQQPDFNAFTGNRQGLYVMGIPADFDLYIYRDAYTPMIAGLPANQYGTRKFGTTDLDEIHNEDWAMYAGVEFGNDYNYLKTPDSLVVLASSGSSGGRIEVWLDSLDTGLKIAECEIENTGGWTTYKSFKTATLNITGRHDVYLKFVGTGTDRLFRLRSLQFIPKEIKTNVKDDQINILKAEYSLEQNYPNPFNPSTIISYNLPNSGHVKLKIFDLLGRELYTLVDEFQQAGFKNIEFKMHDSKLPSGTYFYQITAGKFTKTKKMIFLK